MNAEKLKFWDFSIALYSHQDVADLCLDLQDRFDLDVNMLLFCCWHASMGIVTNQAALQSATNFSSKWKIQVVQPLRDTRRWMKTADPVNPALVEQYDQLRQQIKRHELAAEKIQQEQLQHLTDSNPLTGTREIKKGVAIEIARENLQNYFQLVSIDPDQATIKQLLHTIANYL